jgi:hypothetical protein
MIAMQWMVQGYVAGHLHPRERRAALIRRPWTRRERLVVLHGAAGRLSIAIEPILCGLTFLALTIGVFFIHTDPHHPDEHNMLVLAPIFAVGVLASTLYACALLIAPLRALAQTFKPIFIVDGYVRYRSGDARSPDGSNGYIAVLDDTARTTCEWVSLGDAALLPAVFPALCEFSEYGGIHRIDGCLTGVLPDAITPFGVGIAPRRDVIA